MSSKKGWIPKVGDVVKVIESGYGIHPMDIGIVGTIVKKSTGNWGASDPDYTLNKPSNVEGSKKINGTKESFLLVRRKYVSIDECIIALKELKSLI